MSRRYRLRRPRTTAERRAAAGARRDARDRSRRLPRHLRPKK